MTKKLVFLALVIKKIVFLAFLTSHFVFAGIKVGVTAGPHAMIMEFVKEQAAKKGITIDIIEFNDFILPNIALNDGELRLNSYQHQPFLDEQVKSRGYKLISIGKTVLMPLGIYSKKLKALDEIQEGAKIALPNDPTNGGRALLLLQKVGLIKVKDVANPSVLDIIDNPKKLTLIELEAPQIPRSLDDVACAVINTDFVLLSGMDPKSAISLEGTDSPYVNLLVVRAGDEKSQEVQDFLNVYHSDETKKFIKETFKGAVVAGW